jgi:tetratricopeptide (TPR) repeat protein
LVEATHDDYRAVRIRAAESLAQYPLELVPPEERRSLGLALDELLAALRSQPDDYFSHYGLGNLHFGRGEFRLALAAFEVSLRIRPDFVPALVNIAMTQARLGEADAAEASLRAALEIEPANAAAHFNLGLLLLERAENRQAETHLRAALEASPGLAPAAYNLCVLLAEDRIDEALLWCRRAADSRPDDPRHAYTFAFYQHLAEDSPAALLTLRRLIERHPAYGDAYVLLGTIYEEEADTAAAIAAYRRALETGALTEDGRRRIRARLEALESPPQ